MFVVATKLNHSIPIRHAYLDIKMMSSFFTSIYEEDNR